MSEVPKDDDASWRGKLRKFLLDIGVKEATVDASFTYPGEFLNEVLSRSWEAGVDKVYVSLIGVHVDSTPRELDRMEKLFKSILESVAETPLVICLGRDNKLDMYVSTVRAMNGDAPLQQIRESAEPFDAENVTVRERRDDVAGVGRVRFDEARYQEFVRNDKRWTRTTSRAGEAHDNHCVNLKYEDDLSTPKALAETVRWLHDRYALDLNHEATKLLKLERVNAPVTAADILNVRALNAHVGLRLRGGAMLNPVPLRTSPVCVLVCGGERACAGWVASIKEAIAAAAMTPINAAISQALEMQAVVEESQRRQEAMTA